jgi:hypothetical protein
MRSPATGGASPDESIETHDHGVGNVEEDALSNLIALLRMNLFTYRDLWAWLDAPFQPPPELPEPLQSELALG